jgi:hypothetical protein
MGRLPAARFILRKSKLFIRHLQEVGIGRNAIQNPWLFAWCDKVLSDIRVDRPELSQDFSNAHTERIHVQLVKLDPSLGERLADVSRVQLEIRQNLVRISVFIEFRRPDGFAESHNGRAAYNN